MTAHTEQRDRPHIVVGIDGSEGSLAALRWAADEAGLHGAALDAVIVYEPPTPLPYASPAGGLALPAGATIDSKVFAARAEEVLEETLRAVFGEERPPFLTSSVEEGSAVAVLVARSLDADLLAMGSRGQGGFSGLLAGSVAEQCVRHARCTVAVVR